MVFMASNVAFIFPGQGSQHPGMGKDFAETFSQAKHVFEEADDILGYHLSQLIFNGPESTLTMTKHSQGAIFVNSIAILTVLNHLFPQLHPKMCGGLSLGEYTALAARKSLPFPDCLKLVQKRGTFMHDACENTKGTMAVIIGLTSDVVEDFVKEMNLPNELWVANYNCPGQVVISGTIPAITAATTQAKVKGARQVIPLQVHGAFHSGLMKSAEDRLSEHISAAAILPSSIQFAMNVPGDFVNDVPKIKENLIKQVTHPVKWEQCIRAMDQSGVELFVEIGCGTTLAGMNKRIGVKAPIVSVNQVSQITQLEKLLQGS